RYHLLSRQWQDLREAAGYDQPLHELLELLRRLAARGDLVDQRVSKRPAAAIRPFAPEDAPDFLLDQIIKPRQRATGLEQRPILQGQSAQLIERPGRDLTAGEAFDPALPVGDRVVIPRCHDGIGR